ncbi:MAG: TetR/AcrR family transcriptional regulator [Gemmatimonadota bacterium]
MAESRWQRRRDARPAELLEAAVQCFGETGYLATRVEEIASRAGVTVGTVYRYFPNKEALFNAVLDESRKRLPAGWAMGERDPARLLRETIERWWQLLSEPAQAVLLRETLAGTGSPEAAAGYAREVRSRLEQQFGGVLRLGMAAGQFRSVDVPGVARALADTLIGGAIARPPAEERPYEDPAAHTAVVFGTLIHGIVNRAPAPAPTSPDRPTVAPPPRAAAPPTRADSW